MKSAVFLVLVLAGLLARSTVLAADYFGTPTGPGLGAAPSAPEPISPPVLVPMPGLTTKPAAPGSLFLSTPAPGTKAPFKSALDQPAKLAPASFATPAPSLLPAAPASGLGGASTAFIGRSAATPVPSALPSSPPSFEVSPGAFLQALGPLREDMIAWFAFNSRERGGLAWSPETIFPALSHTALLRDTEGQRVADFNAEGAGMQFNPPVALGPRYTIAAWMSFPVAQRGVAILFRGVSNDLLNILPTGHFGCLVDGRARVYGETLAPASGWHHVALSVDGRQSTVYLDGRAIGSIPVVSEGELGAVGNYSSDGERSRTMSLPMDDLAIFQRELAELEIGRVMLVRGNTTVMAAAVSAPTAPAAAAAPRAPFKSALDQPVRPAKKE